MLELEADGVAVGAVGLRGGEETGGHEEVVGFGAGVYLLHHGDACDAVGGYGSSVACERHGLGVAEDGEVLYAFCIIGIGQGVGRGEGVETEVVGVAGIIVCLCALPCFTIMGDYFALAEWCLDEVAFVLAYAIGVASVKRCAEALSPHLHFFILNIVSGDVI